MTLSALLVCLDNAAADVLRLVLEELSIRVESCPDVARASIRLAQQRFDVVVLDCDSQAEIEGLLRETRLSRVNDSTLAVAVVSGQDSIREMFSLGVNFVLYKPVSHERALSSLRAARAVMRKEKRRSARASVHAHATVDYANVEREKATLVDLAQDGMAVLFGKKLPPTSKVYFQFQLPGQKSSVRLSGQVVWQDWNGRAGIQFVDVPKTSRRLLTEYLGSVLQKATEPFPDVTVEMEIPVVRQSMLVGSEPSRFAQPLPESERQEPQRTEAKGSELQISETHILEAPPSRAAEGESGARLRSEPDNRRGQARYACRVGAEVYRTGIAVPTHCCLTDLSAGGCYLEVPLPFPQGSSIEITVRTYTMKLRLRGIVQTSHPGYGMGVAFDLKAKDDNDHLKKLIDFVSSAEGNPEN